MRVGSRFRYHPARPVYVPQGHVCSWKRTRDAGILEAIEDGDAQIRACATAFVKVNKRIELEFEAVRAELFELDRWARAPS